MGDEQKVYTVNPEGVARPADEPQRRARTQIEFPYSDLQRAVEMASKLHEQVGTAACDLEQLASWLDQSATGGSFRSRLSAARMFGFIEASGGRVSLTPIGQNVIDPGRRQASLVEAFLRVPLYAAMYDQYKNYALPPVAAIERQMVALGVPDKQKDRARQTFTSSAQTAGFIDPSTGRFTKPPVAAAPPPLSGRDSIEREESGKGGGSGDGHKPPPPKDEGRHPFIEGLLKTLPEPGTQWSAQDRAKWLNAAAQIFGLIYEGDGSLNVQIKPDNEHGG
jgi:hypothetical protein